MSIEVAVLCVENNGNLFVRTTGCDCCSSSNTYTEKSVKLSVIDEYLSDLEEELARVKELRRDVEKRA